MDTHTLQHLIVDALEDIKAQDIQVFDTTGLTSLFDRLIICSGTSNRQTKALAANVRDKVRENQGSVISIEGEETGEWVLVDCNDVIVHIMQPALRLYYNLEEIWGTKPVALRTAKKVAAKKAPAKKVTAKKVAAKKTTTKAAPAKKAAAKKSSVKKGSVSSANTPVAAKKVSRKTVAVKKPAMKKVAATKTTT